ncbi:hypothetical protein F4Y93_06075 [Candidatus Poribacteria bacterium]|nr:hypothetical protein [Candidatus Poribacteria bacterium]
MKTLIFSVMLCCVISLPTRAALTPEDLDKIRLIVKEEVKTEITASEKRMKEYVDIRFNTVEKRFDDFKESVNKRFDGVNRQIDHANNLTYALIALIIFAIGIPAWQNRRDRKDNSKIEVLTQEIEMLKQHINVSR